VGQIGYNLMPLIGQLLPLLSSSTISGQLQVYSTDAVPGLFSQGNQGAIGGQAMKIDNLFELEPAAFPLKNEAAIWSTSSYAYAGFSQTMTANTVPAQGSIGELVTLFAYANSNGAIAPVTALLADSVARQSSSFVNGANIIARNVPGVSGAKLIGLEIDVQAASGTTISSNSAGLYVNIFETASSSPAIQLGGISGTWQNGFVSNAVTGAHFTVQTGAPASLYGLNLSQGTYTNSAIVLGNSVGTGGINFGGGNFGSNPFMWGDSSANANIDLGTTPGKLNITFASGVLAFQVLPILNAVNYIQIAPGTTGNPASIVATGSDTNVDLDFFCKGAGLVKFNGTSHFTPNGTTATTMTSVGPSGAHTTVQEWLTILDATGTVRYIPCY
jgi:hypothetical protein